MKTILRSILFPCILISVFESTVVSMEISALSETDLNQERDYLLIKNEIICRLGPKYRCNNFRFTQEKLDLEVERAEYLYEKSKQQNPYQYPDISKLFYKKRELYKYVDQKIRDHETWAVYTRKFMRHFDVNAYQHYVNFSQKPFSEIFSEFLAHEQLEAQKWQEISQAVHATPQAYLLDGPYHSHQITGVDSLHAKGFEGSGAEVIVWDCGFVDSAYVNFDPNDNHVKDPSRRNGYKSDDEHGTHVSGIIGADNSSGLKRGVAYNASILPVRYSGIPDLIERIRDSKSKIISASFHFLLDRDNVRDLDKLTEELQKNDRLLVMASGNDSKFLTPELSPNFYQYWFRGMWVGNHNAWIFDKNPELAKRILLVGSLKEDGVTVSGFSNLPGVMSDHFLFAPGENIVSTVAFDKFDKMSGTSMATPHVSGILALINKHYPSLSAEELKACVLRSCDAFWQDPDYYKPEIYGAGRINAVKAMIAAKRLSKVKQTLADEDLIYAA